MSPEWKPGAGPLGALDPLLGAWVAEGATENGPFRCERRFDRVLVGRYVQLVATWEVPGRPFEELALFGPDGESRLHMWSFTSDGRQAAGPVGDSWDLPRPNVVVESALSTGKVRFAYWPDKPAGGVRFVVESRQRRGWERMLEHVYVPLEPPA